MRAFGLTPGAVVAAAAGVTIVEQGKTLKLTRQYLLQLRKRQLQPRESRMRLIVAALRIATGVQLDVADAFDVDPGSLPPATTARGEQTLVSVFSITHTPLAWRIRMPDDAAGQPTAEESVERVYHEYAGLLQAIARERYGVPAGDAEALVHDIFADFLERRDEVRDLRAYFRGATQNACRHYWRRRRNEAPLVAAIDTPDEQTPSELDQWWTRLAVSETLARLGTKCRETLERECIRDEPTSTIAHHFATSSDYVRQLLHTCRKRARAIHRAVLRPTDDETLHRS